jgi:hypothetical protein
MLYSIMPKILIHTASLYAWFQPYTDHLDDRIHAALDAGFDGVEISNGVPLLTWVPQPRTVERLRTGGHLLTIHAELGEHFSGSSLGGLERLVARLPVPVANVVFHPDELTRRELSELPELPFAVTVENMDRLRNCWRTPAELRPLLVGKVGLTYDTAHAEEHCLSAADFAGLPIHEVHLSISDRDGLYSGHAVSHALTLYRPEDFPTLPPAPIVVVEGVVPPSPRILRQELDFVRHHLN